MDNLIDLEFIRNLAVLAATAKQPSGKEQTVFVPEGFKSVKIPALHEIPLPDHIQQNVGFFERESFTRYVKQYKGPSTQIFAHKMPEGAEFVGVMDYHESGNERTPNHCQHIANFNTKHSKEFQAWLLIHGKALTQEQFLDHIRRWGYTITSHTDADMIEMMSNLDFNTKGEFSSKVERTTGGRKLLFNEVVEGQTGGPKQITVPDVISMRNAIFEGGTELDYSADLLYRVGGGLLKIIVEVKRYHKVIEEAVKSLVDDIVAETGIEPLIGTVSLD